MFLARAFLNPISRAVRADLADPVSLHRTIMRAFPDDAGPRAREAHAVLHRVDEDARRGRFVLHVQSATRPDFSRLDASYFLDLGDDLDLTGTGGLENPAVRDVDDERSRIGAGDRFVFRLRANTTRKITKLVKDTNLPTKNGQRVPVRGEEGRLAWLERHASKAGFRVGDVQVIEVPSVSSRGTGRSFAGASFEGHLLVTDPGAFREGLAKGLGPAKAFGFGLLSIQRAR